MPFDGKCQNLQMTLFALFLLRYDQCEQMQTYRQTHIEIEKPIAIGEILQICLKMKRRKTIKEENHALHGETVWLVIALQTSHNNQVKLYNNIKIMYTAQ